MDESIDGMNGSKEAGWMYESIDGVNGSKEVRWIYENRRGGQMENMWSGWVGIGVVDGWEYVQWVDGWEYVQWVVENCELIGWE